MFTLDGLNLFYHISEKGWLYFFVIFPPPPLFFGQHKQNSTGTMNNTKSFATEKSFQLEFEWWIWVKVLILCKRWNWGRQRFFHNSTPFPDQANVTTSLNYSPGLMVSPSQVIENPHGRHFLLHHCKYCLFKNQIICQLRNSLLHYKLTPESVSITGSIATYLRNIFDYGEKICIEHIKILCIWLHVLSLTTSKFKTLQILCPSSLCRWGTLRGHNWDILPIGYSVLLPWIQTSLS